MNLLALDVGITTGYVVMAPKEELLSHGAIDAHELETMLRKLKKTADYCVAETPNLMHRGEVGDQLRKLMRTVKMVFPPVLVIDPMMWKNTSVAQTVTVPRKRFKTQHEKDAFIIATWWWRTRSLPNAR